MDADEDEPLNRPTMPVGSEQTATQSTAAGEDQTSSHTANHDDQEHQTPDGPVATATDVALEQDS